jgi:hypothetical protein
VGLATGTVPLESATGSGVKCENSIVKTISSEKSGEKGHSAATAGPYSSCLAVGPFEGSLRILSARGANNRPLGPVQVGAAGPLPAKARCPCGSGPHVQFLGLPLKFATAP